MEVLPNNPQLQRRRCGGARQLETDLSGLHCGQLFVGCLAGRLMTLNEDHYLLAPSQKGFIPAEGCLDHNVVLRPVIQDARRSRQECVVVWLDLKNAFGSVPHQTIAKALVEKSSGPSVPRRKQLVKREGSRSPLLMEMGKSQLTSPLLFDSSSDAGRKKDSRHQLKLSLWVPWELFIKITSRR